MGWLLFLLLLERYGVFNDLLEVVAAGVIRGFSLGEGKLLLERVRGEVAKRDLNILHIEVVPPLHHPREIHALCLYLPHAQMLRILR